MEEKELTVSRKVLSMMEDPIAKMSWEKWIAQGKAKLVEGDQDPATGVDVVVTFDQDVDPEEYPMTEAYIKREKNLVKECLLDLLENDEEFRALFKKNRQPA